MDPYERHTHSWCERAKGAATRKKRKENFGVSWIYGRSRETDLSSFTNSFVVNGSGLAGMR